MPDLFARLAERTLGLAPIARPLTPPVFATAPAVDPDASTAAEGGSNRPVLSPQPRETPDGPPMPAIEAPRQPAPANAPQLTTAAKRSLDLQSTGEEAGPITGTPGENERPPTPARLTREDAGSTTRIVREVAVPTPRLIGEDHGPTTAMAEMRTEVVPEERLRGRLETRLEAAETSVHATSLPVAAPLPRQRVEAGLDARETSVRATPPRERRREREQAGSDGQVIEVNIGRVEVRALFPPAQPVAPARRASDSALSLADYLKERDGGLR